MSALDDHHGQLLAAARSAGQQLPCLTLDPDTWFAQAPSAVEYAKSLCHDCPAQQLCLEGALERNEPWGVWGGQLIAGGRVQERKRPRGRPRKNPVAA